MKMRIDFSGLEKLQKDLDKAAKRSEKLSKGVSTTEVLNNAFMVRNTKHRSAEAFFEAFGRPWKTEKEFEAIPEDELDAFVKANSKFKSWEEMLASATEDYVFSGFSK